ncbi:MAG: hypothetical protein V8T62_00915 [Oscillospiraceae bacterium]
MIGQTGIIEKLAKNTAAFPFLPFCAKRPSHFSYEISALLLDRASENDETDLWLQPTGRFLQYIGFGTPQKTTSHDTPKVYRSALLNLFDKLTFGCKIS